MKKSKTFRPAFAMAMCLLGVGLAILAITILISVLEISNIINLELLSWIIVIVLFLVSTLLLYMAFYGSRYKIVISTEGISEREMGKKHIKWQELRTMLIRFDTTNKHFAPPNSKIAVTDEYLQSSIKTKKDFNDKKVFFQLSKEDNTATDEVIPLRVREKTINAIETYAPQELYQQIKNLLKI